LYKVKEDGFMEHPSSPETRRPPSWAEVLDQVQNALWQAEEAAGQREKSFAALPEANPSGKFEETWRQCLGRLRERFAALEEAAARAGQNAEPADMALQAGEEGIRRWLEEIHTVGQKLADGGPSSVK
jgi:hypothetical protein